ncbi:transcriptional adapter 1 isoform X2 [Columba livia]|uniref:transcriptional adapter 1 isoform X2 n=1 Tax=Columba livia TaxID=8932 RepID=UPI0031BB3C2F
MEKQSFFLFFFPRSPKEQSQTPVQAGSNPGRWCRRRTRATGLRGTGREEPPFPRRGSHGTGALRRGSVTRLRTPGLTQHVCDKRAVLRHWPGLSAAQPSPALPFPGSAVLGAALLPRAARTGEGRDRRLCPLRGPGCASLPGKPRLGPPASGATGDCAPRGCPVATLVGPPAAPIPRRRGGAGDHPGVRSCLRSRCPPPPPGAHESPRKSWKRMRPCVVSASKLGASSPSSRPGMAATPAALRSLPAPPLRLREATGAVGPPGRTRDGRSPPPFTAAVALSDALRRGGERGRWAVLPRPRSPVMATYVSELEAAKKSLSEALGENVKQYWANLKLWFKQKISKEEFDLEARRLLTQDNVHSHNDFLLAILTRCQILVSAPEGAGSLPWPGGSATKPGKPKGKKKISSVRQKFDSSK